MCIRDRSRAAKATKKHAEIFWIKEEIKSLYIKESTLNTRLYKLHLHIFNDIHPAIINNVMESVHKYVSDVTHNT